MSNEAELARLERRLKRATAARLEAEAIAERGLRDLFERQRQIALLEAIAVAANEAADVNDAMQISLHEICRFTGWPVGHVFYVPEGDSGDSPSLHPSGLWHVRDSDRYAPFCQATLDTKFTHGIGMPGRVWSSAEPVWIDDVTVDVNFPRTHHAQRSGLRAAFAFPVMIGSEVVAVLEFFATEPLAPDEALLSIMKQIGTQLGRVVERKRAREQLIHDALHDALTKLGNRPLFLSRLQLALDRARRIQGYRFAVLFIDLDRFKSVNDGLGHHAGDQLIVAVAQRLMHALRNTDFVARGGAGASSADWSGESLLARLGGDEFTIILDGISDANAPIRVAERILHALTEPFTLGNQYVYTTASVGIALSESHYVSVEDLLRDADIAMYRAKLQGGARWVMFDQAMQEQAVRRLELENDLRHAIERREFMLHYQPIVSLADGPNYSQIHGFEALIRWRHPERGLVSPVEFIPMAEEMGLIGVIGDWVLAEACGQLRRWQESFAQAQQLTMSVNISASQLAHPTSVAALGDIIHAAGVAPSSIKLELTENVVMSDTTEALQTLHQLKKLGVQLSLDDFGTGYSSLSYLRRLPIDTLKIDRSFVSEMDSKEDKRQIVEIVVMLARTFGLNVVAEGAETAAEVAELKRLGCDFAQGYFFFKPMAQDTAEQALRRQFDA